ncbi:hypothetical protein [Mucilaginibacter antarcticus]
MGCKKENLSAISPAQPVIAKAATATVTATKADSVKTTSYNPTNTSNPEYWYNGTTGTAQIRVSCKDCSAIAKIGETAVPFMFNDEGVGTLRYTPKTGLSIYIAVCPGGTKAATVDILDNNKASLFNYAGVITANWLNTFVIK